MIVSSELCNKLRRLPLKVLSYLCDATYPFTIISLNTSNCNIVKRDCHKDEAVLNALKLF